MRRPLAKITKYLLIGLALNLAAAWGLVALHGRPTLSYARAYEDPHDDGVFYALHRPGIMWIRPPSILDSVYATVHRYDGPVWWPPDATDILLGGSGTAAGWPFLSVCSWSERAPPRVDGNGQSRRVQRWSVVLLEPSGYSQYGWAHDSVILPLRPIWPGLAANTLLYALAAACASWAFSTLRRRRRLGKGLCPWCAYPLGPDPGASPCPECGRALRDRKAAPARAVRPVQGRGITTEAQRAQRAEAVVRSADAARYGERGMEPEAGERHA